MARDGRGVHPGVAFLGVERALAGVEDMEPRIGPEFGDGAGPVVQGVPVGVADRGEEAGGLLGAEPDVGLDVRAERVLPHGLLDLARGVRLDGLERRGDLGGVSGDSGAFRAGAQPGVEPVAGGDADPFDVVEGLGERGQLVVGGEHDGTPARRYGVGLRVCDGLAGHAAPSSASRTWRTSSGRSSHLSTSCSSIAAATFSNH